MEMPKYSWKGLLAGVEAGSMTIEEAEEIIKERIELAYMQGRRDILIEIKEKTVKSYGEKPKGQGTKG